jgi:hypothetical protein
VFESDYHNISRKLNSIFKITLAKRQNKKPEVAMAIAVKLFFVFQARLFQKPRAPLIFPD